MTTLYEWLSESQQVPARVRRRCRIGTRRLYPVLGSGGNPVEEMQCRLRLLPAPGRRGWSEVPSARSRAGRAGGAAGGVRRLRLQPPALGGEDRGSAIPRLPARRDTRGGDGSHALGAGVTGLRGRRPGHLSLLQAYAEYDKVPAEAVVQLPAALDGVPFPGESVGCAMNVFRRSDIRQGQTVAVIGAGFLGIIFTALATARGARVIAISRRRFAWTWPAATEPRKPCCWTTTSGCMDRVREIAGGTGAATGSWRRPATSGPSIWPGSWCGSGASSSSPGSTRTASRQVNVQLWNWKGIDVINAHERDPKVYLEGIKQGIAAVERGLSSWRV